MQVNTIPSRHYNRLTLLLVLSQELEAARLQIDQLKVSSLSLWLEDLFLLILLALVLQFQGACRSLISLPLERIHLTCTLDFPPFFIGEGDCLSSGKRKHGYVKWMHLPACLCFAWNNGSFELLDSHKHSELDPMFVLTYSQPCVNFNHLKASSLTGPIALLILSSFTIKTFLLYVDFQGLRKWRLKAFGRGLCEAAAVRVISAFLSPPYFFP